MKNQPEISIIIPTYNEEVRKEYMKSHIQSIETYFNKNKVSYEIIIVLDGPTDKTAVLVKEHQNNYKNIIVLEEKINKGKGYALRKGLLEAKGKIRLFTDMDGATPINMLDRFLTEFKKGSEIVIGSRELEKDIYIKKHQPKWKEIAGDFGNFLIHLVLGLWEIKDTQCGFKAFTEKAVNDILPRTTVNRWGIDFEILIIGKKLGYKITELPVEWTDSGDSLVGIRGYINTFKDLFSTRWKLIKGVYNV